MQIQDLGTIAIAVVIAGIVFGLGADILSKTGDNFNIRSVTNQSVATFTANETCTSLGNKPIVAVTEVQNGTNILNSTQYTICADKEKLKLTEWDTDSEALTLNLSYTGWYVTYTHRGTAQYQAVKNATLGVGEIASWMPLIGLIIGAALVIGVVFKSFGGSAV